jgi:hypothetical protein
VSESKYNVVLLDGDGYELSSRPADTLKAAKADAKYLLSDDYARVVETSHADMQTEKVEVRGSAGEVVWDKFI